MQQTYFQKVVNFNRQFGILESDEMKPKPDIFETSPDTVAQCMKLIREENAELEKAVAEKDFVEVIDAIGDSIYVLLGMSARLGVNMDDAFSLIHENNMSKFCTTEEEAQKSVEKYINTKDEHIYHTPSYRKAVDDIHWVVFNESDKKVLKSHKWEKVDLSSVCE